MATKYLSTDGLHFQYVVDDGKDFYRALAAQGYTVSVTAIVEEDAEGGRAGEVKPIFPGGNITNDQPIY